MLLIISDASVLVAIENSKLTLEVFNLPWQFAVPDTLFFEELAKNHDHLLKFGLITKTMSGELIAEAYSLHQKYVKLSVNDMLALILAKDEGCPLLTDDKILGQVARELNVEVRGIMWLVEQILQEKSLDEMNN